MPVIALDHLHRYENIPCPYTFQMKNKINGKTAYCGVLEFTSGNSHVIYVPKWLMMNIGVKDGERIDIVSATLEKGLSILLRPQTELFFKLSNPKAVLERHLKKYTVLYQGEIITLEYLGRTFDIDVIETTPGSAITIIDTDLRLGFMNMFDQ